MSDIRAKYYWKELTSDGLLKEPKDLGPYYDTTTVNFYGHGFDSEEEAVFRLRMLKVAHEYELIGDYVLVKVYG